MNGEGTLAPAGTLSLAVVRRGATVPVPVEPLWPARPPELLDILQHGLPQVGLPAEVNAWRLRNVRNLWRGYRRVGAARLLRLPHFYGQLWLSVLRADGQVVDLGLASLRVVTTTGVRFICDDFNAGGQDVTTMKFHGFGTGTTPAEGASDTALTTELTTQYNPDNTRPTGTQASATSGANATYTTVATVSPDSGGTIAVTEHGIFSATSAGTLFDRSLFAAVNLVAAADSLQATYVLTMNSGG